MQGVLPIKIPNGARFIASMRQWIPVKTPFDYILCSLGLSVFIDCKTVDKNTFSKSDIKSPHQIEFLDSIEHMKCRAGFLIWFRKDNHVVFYDASKLKKLKTGESVSPLDGEYLGNYESFALGNLFR